MSVIGNRLQWAVKNARRFFSGGGAGNLPGDVIALPSVWATLSEKDTGAKAASLKSNRRNARRLPMRLMASILLDPETEIHGIVVNLSEGGMALNLPHPLAVGRTIGVRFLLPGSTTAFEALGEVVWADPNGRVGLRFGEIPRISHKQLLTDWLHHLDTFQPGLGVSNISRGEWVRADAIEDVIFVHDDEFRILKANQALLRRLGRKAGDVLELSCEAVLPGSRKDWRGCPYCSIAPGMASTPDPCFGGFSAVSSYSYAESPNERLGTIHVIRDVTHEQTTEQKYRMLFERVQEGVFVSAPDGRLLDCNEALVRMLGYTSRAELLALNATQLYAEPAERERFRREIERYNGVRNFEVKLRRKDGSIICLWETSFATRDSLGNISSYQGFVLDVTDKKKAEQELERRNHELFLLNKIAGIAEGSFSLNEILGRILIHITELVGACKAAVFLASAEDNNVLRRCALYGYMDENALPFELRVPAALLDEPKEERIHLVNKRQLSGLSAEDPLPGDTSSASLYVVMWGREAPLGLLHVVKEGSEFSAADEDLLGTIGRQMAGAIDQVRLYNETSRAYQVLRQTQEQLIQSEKMASVGQLTAGVAHELNNPLTAIMGYTELLKDQQLSDPVRQFVEKLHAQALRTHKIVQNLLSFARQHKPQKRETNIVRVLENTLSLREYELSKSNIQIQRSFEFPLPAVMADAYQMEQVFLNIINNAVYEMMNKDNGGTLKIRALVRDGRVVVGLRDSGPGIKEPKRIFDPFYTTKPVGKGTGLGLSICYGLVKEHGGEIVASNAPEGGADFEIRLPALVNSAVRTDKRISFTRDSSVRGRVLLCDGDAAFQAFVQESLRVAGLEVSVVAKVADAIARLEKEKFEAIVVEGNTPGDQDGIDLYKWLKQLYPELLGSLVMTFTDFDSGKARRFAQEEGAVSHLLKPVEMLDLFERVTAAIVGPKQPAAGIPTALIGEEDVGGNNEKRAEL